MSVRCGSGPPGSSSTFQIAEAKARTAKPAHASRQVEPSLVSQATGAETSTPNVVPDVITDRVRCRRSRGTRLATASEKGAQHQPGLVAATQTPIASTTVFGAAAIMAIPRVAADVPIRTSRRGPVRVTTAPVTSNASR